MARRLVHPLFVIFLVATGAFAVLNLPDAPAAPAAEERKREPGAMEPDDWFFRQRAYPHGAIDAEAFREASRQAAALRQAAQARGGAAWQFAGPTNVGGRVTAIAAANTQTYYVGTGSGGVFKTTDGGASFTPVGDGLNLSIGDVALDPSNAQTVYVGTGEVNGGGGSLTYGGQGVFRSTDGGQSWAGLGLEETGTIGRILVHPANPNTLWVAAEGKLFATDPHRGVFRSTDGGQTWAKTLFVNDSTGVVDLALNPRSPDTLYAAAWERRRGASFRYYGGAGSGLYRSTNGGQTWTELTSGLPQDANVGRIGVAVAPSRPNVVYAFYSDAAGNPRAFYRSTNGGTTWTARTPVGNSSYEWWFGQVRVDPADYNRVYYGSLTLFASSNGGSSWQDVNGIMHVDHHALWIDPANPNNLVAGNDGGVYRSSNRAQSWAKAAGGFPATQFYTVEIDASQPQRLYGGTQDNGTNRTMTGSLGDWQEIYGGDGFVVLVDPTDNRYVYAESQYGGLGRSTNGGTSFSYALSGVGFGDRFNWNTPYVFDPQNPATMYLGSNRVYRSTNRAVSWTALSPDLTDGPGSGNLVFGTITTLDAAPAVPTAPGRVLWAGTDDGNVWVSRNGGASWQNVSGALPERWVTRVTAHPTRPGSAYVTFSGYRWDEPLPHVYRTDDYGQTWTPRVGGLPEIPVNDLLFDPADADRLYLGTDAGVFVSDDAGVSWAPLGPGLPAAPVLDLDLHAPTGALVAATYGRGMYRFDIGQAVSTDTTRPAAPQGLAEPLALTASPNPADGPVTLRFTLDRPARVGLAAFDAQGRRVAVLAEGERAAGAHAVSWDLRPLPAGAYLVRLDASGQTATARVTRVR
jgi:photosystem II stability/assembly factor-like uncharacterized protein